MEHKIKFSDWLYNTYASPKDMLMDSYHLTPLSKLASQAGALIDRETIASWPTDVFSCVGESFYLKNLKGVSDAKCYAMIRTGTTANGVAIPIVLIRPYNTNKFSAQTYSPASVLWKQFHAFRKNNTSLLPSAPQPNKQNFEVSNEREKAIKKAEKELSEAARNAALVAVEKLMQHSEPLHSLPDAFKNQNLGNNPQGLRIVTSPVTARLYSRNKRKWFTGTVAQPRDLFVPLIDLSSGEIVNGQIISAFRSSKKRFIAGAQRVGTCALIRNEDSADWIVTEGYKTGLAIKTLDDANVACAMAANYTPQIVQLIKTLHPNAKVFVANDNDDTGRDYRDKCHQLGAQPIGEPDLFSGADWADVLKELGLAKAISWWMHAKSLAALK